MPSNAIILGHDLDSEPGAWYGYRRIILKWSLKKSVGRARAGLVWLSIGTVDELL
jgi:hypothetical protein